MGNPTDSRSRVTRGLLAGCAVLALAAAVVLARNVARGGIRGALAFVTNSADDLGHARHGSRPVYIGLGSVANNSGVRGADLSAVAQDAMQHALSQRSEVTLTPATAQGRGAHSAASGHFFDANIQSIQPRGSGVRVAVSVVVSTYPGREYEFESATAITLTGGSADSPQAQEDAVRTAMASAANSAVNQITQMQ